MRIVDAHMHVWTRAPGWRGSATPARSYGKVTLDGREQAMLPPCFVDGTSPPELAIAYMDRHGVERAVLVQEWIEGFLNECVAEAVARFPGRFVGEALLDPRDAHSVAELDSLLAAGRLQGLKLPVGSLRRLDASFELDSPVALEWLEVCERRGAFVTVHPQAPEQAHGPLSRAVERFGGVRFILAHMGLPDRPGWGRMLELCRLPHVFMELAAVPYLFKEQYPCPQSRVVLQDAVRRVGADKFLWGSDYPRTLTDLTYPQQLGWVRDAEGLSGEEKAKILGLNALRVIWRPAA